MARASVTIALTGSGGVGVMTAGQMLLSVAGRAGFQGLMTRSLGPQIRGGEAAAFLRIAGHPVESAGDRLDLMIAFDWQNVERFAAELALDGDSVVLHDPAHGAVPAAVADKGPTLVPVSLSETAKGLEHGRVNMVGLGLVAALLDIATDAVDEVIARALGRKGEAALTAARAGVAAGDSLAAAVAETAARPLAAVDRASAARWNISGNEAAGLGAIRAGIRFCAAYPITPATDVLEYLAPALNRTGGTLLQAEDELASINMILGASYGGVPSVTATSGPGLALMAEGLGLGVAAEIPVTVIDVQRGGPSTGIPTKSEQSDLDIALSGLHGDAPHLVLAATGLGDCLTTTQWAIHLSERLQVPAVVLSDQFLGQARGIIDAVPESGLRAERRTAEPNSDDYRRYALTDDGVSPMAWPGMAGCMYTADGLEHGESGTPSTLAEDHAAQLDKRRDKLDGVDYGALWADISGEGPVAVLTWGSSAGPAREAAERLRAEGHAIRVIAQRLLAPARPDALAAALEGVERILVVEQSHGGQYHRYLRAWYDLPVRPAVLNRPGPLPIRPGAVEAALREWV